MLRHRTRAFPLDGIAAAVLFLSPICANAQTVSSSGSVSAPASAQAAAPAEDTLEEVLVTAEKKTSTAQTTPIAMSVYNNQELSDAGVVNMETLAYRDPNLNFTSQGGLPILTLLERDWC